MSEKDKSTTIRGTRLHVPKRTPDNLAREAAQQVAKRIDTIETEAGRIDTQGFAIQAAFEFALAIQHQKAEAESDTAELLQALDALQAKLADISARHDLNLDTE